MPAELNSGGTPYIVANFSQFVRTEFQKNFKCAISPDGKAIWTIGTYSKHDDCNVFRGVVFRVGLSNDDYQSSSGLFLNEEIDDRVRHFLRTSARVLDGQRTGVAGGADEIESGEAEIQSQVLYLALS